MVDFYTVPLFSSTFSLCSVEFESRSRESRVEERHAVTIRRCHSERSEESRPEYSQGTARFLVVAVFL